jgi:hypothetical protein
VAKYLFIILRSFIISVGDFGEVFEGLRRRPSWIRLGLPSEVHHPKRSTFANRSDQNIIPIPSARQREQPTAKQDVTRNDFTPQLGKQARAIAILQQPQSIGESRSLKRIDKNRVSPSAVVTPTKRRHLRFARFAASVELELVGQDQAASPGLRHRDLVVHQLP